MAEYIVDARTLDRSTQIRIVTDSDTGQVYSIEELDPPGDDEYLRDVVRSEPDDNN